MKLRRIAICISLLLISCLFIVASLFCFVRGFFSIEGLDQWALKEVPPSPFSAPVYPTVDSSQATPFLIAGLVTLVIGLFTFVLSLLIIVKGLERKER